MKWEYAVYPRLINEGLASRHLWLNEMGAEGWELITIKNRGADDVLYFKRNTMARETRHTDEQMLDMYRRRNDL